MEVFFVDQCVTFGCISGFLLRLLVLLDQVMIMNVKQKVSVLIFLLARKFPLANKELALVTICTFDERDEDATE